MCSSFHFCFFQCIGVLMMWFGVMYWNPAIPPMAAVSMEILKGNRERAQVRQYGTVVYTKEEREVTQKNGLYARTFDTFFVLWTISAMRDRDRAAGSGLKERCRRDRKCSSSRSSTGAQPLSIGGERKREGERERRLLWRWWWWWYNSMWEITRERGTWTQNHYNTIRV